MKKKQVNLFEEFAKAGKEIAEQLQKENPINNMFAEIKNDELNQVYEGCKEVGEFLSHMIKGFMDGGLTKEEAMAFTMQNYIDMKKQAE
ncbi:hypothetical protein [Bacillus toyonensis]|uniref:hypothetical protein n=1 Tax=Bacillus toyonensis TaxID=155322 RepID=UPI000BFC92E3|nr:hypothetical protein [Bacillus toyonensis]PHC14392.1 hypothetical protein COF03_25110 [Bacillus toyonensis]PHD38277.1 hypothetical protein COF48_00520 [Bacillus toyonensis]